MLKGKAQGQKLTNPLVTQESDAMIELAKFDEKW
jgi:hypothetical protein